MKRVLFLLLICTLHSALSQEAVIDSLKSRLDSFQDYNESYVDVLNEISFEYIKSSPSNASYYVNLAISLSKELDYEKGLIRATANKGSSYWVIGLQDEALSYYLLALSYNAKNYPLEYIRISNNIGEVFKKKSLFDSAGKYYLQALEMVKDKLADRQPVILFINVAEIFYMKDQIDSADYYYKLGYQNALTQNDQRGLAYAYLGLSEIAFSRDSIAKAIELGNKSLKIRYDIEDTRGIIQSLIKKGTLLIHEAKYDSALLRWNEAEERAIAYQALDLLNEVYLAKYNYYFILGKFREAAVYIGQYQTIQDSLQSQEFISSLNRIKGALLSEINEAENRILRQEQIRERAENRSRIVTISATAVLLFAMVYFIYQRRRRAKVQFEDQQEALFNQSLLKLSKEVNLKQPEFSEFIGNFLKSTTKSLNCDRASYWIYNKVDEQIECFKLLENGRFRPSPDPMSHEVFPAFYNALFSNRTVAIDDLSDTNYFDQNERFVQKTKIKSLIYGSLFLDDELIGVISFAVTRQLREWTYAEQRYVGSLADIIVSAFAHNQSQQLEKEKEELIQKLRVRNKSLQEFNSVISHNLREPLTQIIGFADLLQSPELEDDQETPKIISSIASASQKIDSAIKDLSTVLNEKDPLPADYRNTSFEKVLREVTDLLPREIELHQPELKKNFKVETILTYKPFLFDILYHLLSNSLKFSKNDQALFIAISTYQEDNKNIICIEDNGRGMDLNRNAKKLFKMYQRFHLNTEGRGIGLYLVKNRITSLGGEVFIESTVEKGTTVKIELPIKPPTLIENSH